MTGHDGESRGPDRAQFGVAAALGLLGLLVIGDALRLAHVTSSNDPIGPKPMPLVVGALLLVTAALYALDIARGGVGEMEAGEDVDLGESADWKTLAMLAAVFIANALLIQPLGWVISGTLLFAGTSYALGSRHIIRATLIGLTLSLITFYGFAIGLGVNLPAGILQGIL
ncbi:MAG: tripartite tricarboxylate transporter TctB family protein [Micrococcales bacterium]|nr:tripartite tricarboxylate transporter TctB family protein [Micrococcales bacterium]